MDKILELHRLKIIILFSFVYAKCLALVLKTWKKNGVKVIADKKGKLWLNEDKRKEGLDRVCLRNTTNVTLQNIESLDMN